MVVTLRPFLPDTMRTENQLAFYESVSSAPLPGNVCTTIFLAAFVFRHEGTGCWFYGELVSMEFLDGQDWQKEIRIWVPYYGRKDFVTLPGWCLISK